MVLHFDDLPELYNYVEVVLWPGLGIVIGVHGFRRRGAVRFDCLIAAIVLFVFGISDWFEANTGNEWWHPWWLLAWKAACVLALLILIYRGQHRRKMLSQER